MGGFGQGCWRQGKLACSIVAEWTRTQERESEAQAYFQDLSPAQTPRSERFSFKLLETNPGEIAKQLTLIAFERWPGGMSWMTWIRFSAIAPTELYNQAWTHHENKHTLAPNVTWLISQFNRLSSWVATEIVSCYSSLKRRVQTLKHFIAIGYVSKIS